MDEPTDPTPGADPAGTDGAADPGTTADGPTAGPVGDAAAEGAEGEAVAAAASRPRTAVLVGVLAVVAVLLATAALWPRDEAPDPAPVALPTTTTTAPPTTAPAPPSYQVATAVAPEIVVSSTPPPEWATATVDLAGFPQAPPVASQATTPARPPLPRPGFPIEGRVSEPSGGWRFANPTAFGSPFTMLVVEGRGEWLQVEIPVRPNGTPGWVRRSEVTLAEQRTRVEIHLEDRLLRAFDGDSLIAETPVVIGTEDTRTPTGRFYLTDKEQRDADSFYGPWVLAINAYSEQMDVFDGGVPVVALHGTSNPAQVGQAISNGCIRLPNDVITALAEQLPLGTVVDIFPGASTA